MQVLKTIQAVLLGATLLAGTAMAEEGHEIYSLMPNTALSGVIDPNMSSRSDIEKALPISAGDDGKLTIGWSEMTLGNPWFVAVIEGAQATAEKYGYDLQVQVNDFDVAKQSAQVDNFITLGVDVIVIDPVDVLGAVADVERAVEAGIPVIAIGTAPDAAAPIVSTVTANPYGNGFEAGKYIVANWEAETPINAAMIVGLMGNSTSESRLNGMVSGIVAGRSEQLGLGMSKEDAMLKGFNLFQEVKSNGSMTWEEGNFNVLAWGAGGWTEEGGLTAAEDILTAQGDNLNLILAENDFMGIGALNALDNVGRNGTIPVACAADGFAVSLGLIADGEMMTTGPNSGTATGIGAIELIHQLVEGKLDGTNLPLASYYPSGVISIENVADYIDEDKSNPFFRFEIPAFLSVDELKATLN
ncbi:sugar ABC transporter substrate-binding protein [Pacificoceanicola onchidii]|uniref:sugar ABC transporter substrate-binding protein n=1 Tax=Pacificoceanicola onchidii TaxID=2562685 RepID=UPI0010A61DD7|nr:sugar ABC transporter substrate-binding protein [Pacificoceanicola onchidii]